MNRIIIVQTAFLGDLILTIPLFRAVKRIFPDSYLTALIRPEYRELLRNVSEIDEFIFFDKHRREKGMINFYRKIREVRLRSAHLAVSPHRSARTAILLWQSRIPRRIGFSVSALSFLYPERVPRDASRHEVDRNLSLVAALGKDPRGFDRLPHLPVREEWDREAARILPGPEEYIGIAPSSVWPTKRWTPGGFAGLIDLLAGKLKIRTVILGEPGAEQLGQEIVARTKAGAVNLAGKTSLGVLAALVSRLRLVVSNDSGLVHIASARNIPCVVIYGPTSSRFGYGPLGTGSRVVEAELACRPCHVHGPRTCPEKHFECMRGITPEIVFREVSAAINQVPKSKLQ